MGLLQDKFEEKFEALTSNEKIVLLLLDSHLDYLENNTLTELAQKLNSSNSVLIRIAQKLGFSGFSEFKYKISDLIHEGSDKPIRLLQELQNFTVNESDISLFSESISKAQTIYIMGVGTTKPLAEYFSKKLYQFGHSSVYIYERPMLDLLSNIVRRKDIAIYLSVSGQTECLVHSAQKVRARGVKTFCISSTRSNPLRRNSSFAISSDVELQFFQDYDVTSRVYLFAIIDLILEDYFKRFVYPNF